ncbi:MAG: ThiF family adenylyltransferase [Betaproteobacteria bacterium]
MARLYGDRALERLQRAHVVVAGLGGVGSWVAEALARSGVGKLSLIDMDQVALSNLNRQAHALHSTLGMSKIEAMAQRLRDISPGVELDLHDTFLTPGNLDQCVPQDCDGVADAIDQPRVKAALIAHLRRKPIHLVVCGAAGGRTDPLALRYADLGSTTQDPLLARVRNQLRRHHGFPREAGRSFGVGAVYSVETRRGQLPAIAAGRASDFPPDAGGGSHPAQARFEDPIPGAALSCSGYGSSVMLTASIGMHCAVRIVHKLLTI